MMSVLTLIIATACTNYFHDLMGRDIPAPSPFVAEMRVVISPGSGVTVSKLWPDFQFTANVVDMGGQVLLGEAVFWSVTDNSPNGASIGSNGYLHVTTEIKPAIKVRATAQANAAVYDEITVNLVNGQAAYPPAPQLSAYALSYLKDTVVGATPSANPPAVQVTVANAALIAGQGGVLSYQWYKLNNSAPSIPNPPASGTILTGETNQIFQPPTGTAGKFRYYAVVTNTVSAIQPPGNPTASVAAGPVTVNVTLSVEVTTAQEWNDAIEYVKANGRSASNPMGPSVYTITISGPAEGIKVLNGNRYQSGAADINQKYTFGGYQGTVTLAGNGTLSLGSDPVYAATTNGSGALIGAGPQQTIILNGPSFAGKAGNNQAAVYLRVEDSVTSPESSLIMNAGTISGNTTSGDGGGVYVYRGNFTLTGGTISGNNASGTNGGGGVSFQGNSSFSGIFAMTGGAISGNTTSGWNGGGGVSVNVAGFVLTGGTISGNTTSSYGGGGGVSIIGYKRMGPGGSSPPIMGTFAMSGGAISGNTASGNNSTGGGVRVYFYAVFAMTGGTISGNTASGYGGGVAVEDEIAPTSRFSQSGGTITGNTSGNAGGGVYARAGDFTMTGGTISGNTAAGGGGGVFITPYFMPDGTSFTKTGGIIKGDNGNNVRDPPPSDENISAAVVVNNNTHYGHAVYVFQSRGGGAFMAAWGQEAEVVAAHDMSISVASNGAITATGFQWQE